jgi:hypothetical protein
MQTTTIVTDKHSLKSHYGVTPSTTTTTEKPPGSVEIPPETTPPVLPPDAREQLYNGGAVGPIDHVQISTERVTKLNGILFDLDPQNLRKGPLLPAISNDVQEFYEHCVQRWLANHPLLQHLEVRASGTGIHAILWFDPTVEFATDAERKRWCSIAKIVQTVLPTDPLAPGITATTRALGSVNTKNGQTVIQLKEGRPISPDDVIALADDMCGAPFRTLFRVLTGSDRIAPCPICGWESLVALKHTGKCYACGKITFERLCNELFQPKKAAEVHGG